MKVYNSIAGYAGQPFGTWIDTWGQYPAFTQDSKVIDPAALAATVAKIQKNKRPFIIDIEGDFATIANAETICRAVYDADPTLAFGFYDIPYCDMGQNIQYAQVPGYNKAVAAVDAWEKRIEAYLASESLTLMPAFVCPSFYYQHAPSLDPADWNQMLDQQLPMFRRIAERTGQTILPFLSGHARGGSLELTGYAMEQQIKRLRKEQLDFVIWDVWRPAFEKSDWLAVVREAAK